MGINHYKKRLITLCITLLLFTPVSAATYSTYKQWELDAILAAWAIKHYVDKESHFKRVAKSEKIPPAYAINTSYAQYRRSAQETAFESVLRQHDIHDHCTQELVRIVRVVELAPWRKSEYLDILTFEQELLTLLKQKNVAAGFDYIDHYCQGVQP